MAWINKSLLETSSPAYLYVHQYSQIEDQSITYNNLYSFKQKYIKVFSFKQGEKVYFH